MSRPHALPIPLAEEWEWQQHGLCRGTDTSAFFHPEGERGRARTSRADRAKLLCHQCPVIEACREHALSVGEPYGIWGGMSEAERVAEIKRREEHSLPLAAS